jgi:hypothetical protein
VFPNLGSTQQEAAILVGFFLPLLLAIPVQTHWPTAIKTLFTVAAYAGAGAITAAAAGKLTGKSFWQTSLDILVLGVVGYHGVWKPSNIAPTIETRTNVSGAGAAKPAGGGTPASAPPLAPSVETLLISGARLVEEVARRISTTTDAAVMHPNGAPAEQPAGVVPEPEANGTPAADPVP